MSEFSKIPIAEVKSTWAAVLADIPPLTDVNVHPAWPGEDLLYAPEKQGGLYKAVVYFAPSRATYERHSMRADRQRRLCTVRFNVVIEVLVAGVSNEGGLAALTAESYAYDLWEPIDVHVADDKHLSCPEFVDSAVVDGEGTSAGFTDSGFGFILAMPVEATFRLL